MNDIYLTSTFRNPWNVNFNFKIGEALENRGVTCYLAHRDTNQKGTSQSKFLEDIAGIKSSAIVLAVALNESPNWGAEIGYAYGIKKPILAITDMTHEIPLICEGAISEVIRVENLDSVDQYIDSLVLRIKALAGR